MGWPRDYVHPVGFLRYRITHWFKDFLCGLRGGHIWCQECMDVCVRPGCFCGTPESKLCHIILCHGETGRDGAA